VRHLFDKDVDRKRPLGTGFAGRYGKAHALELGGAKPPERERRRYWYEKPRGRADGGPKEQNTFGPALQATDSFRRGYRGRRGPDFVHLAWQLLIQRTTPSSPGTDGWAGVKKFGMQWSDPVPLGRGASDEANLTFLDPVGFLRVTHGGVSL
jgi:hypothetical protein